MTQHLRILYVGALWEGGTCLQRMKVLQELGYEVIPLDTQPQTILHKENSLRHRISGKLYRWGFDKIGPVVFGPQDLAHVNSQMIAIAKKNILDIIWLDKGLTVEKTTLQQIKNWQPHCKIVGYSPDDMAVRHNQSSQFLDHLSWYDHFFTTKTYGVAELKTLGCPRVHFIGNAFDKHTHYPFKIGKEERSRFGNAVGFIGDFEKYRAKSMFFLATHGIPVRIWGPNWNKCHYPHVNLLLENKPLWGLDYTRAIRSFDINLCFLRKANRDLQTTRSVEIPACGAFMLAERTDEHLALFEEGKEAEFFGSEEELLDKVKYYLAHPEERKHIAAVGYERCVKSGYSYHDRLKEILQIVTGLQ